MKFKYYMHDGPAAFRFELAGILSGDDAAELEQAWRTASSVIEDRILIVDLSFVTRIDEAGRDLLRTWHESGAKLVANSPASRLLYESITGTTLAAPVSFTAVTYEPFFTRISRRAATVLTVLLLALLYPVKASAETMPECRQVPEQASQRIGTYRGNASASSFTPPLSSKKHTASEMLQPE
jgi:ABC-type transporter Mla MlaB component